ncbi:MAG: hypothetical protein ACK2UW_22465 [Anaerolineales bacterium]
MNYAATAFPAIRRIRLPLTRDQLVLLMAAFNMVMLGVETYLAHLISGTIVPREWIPIIFGPIAGMLLLAAGLLSLRFPEAASITATLVFAASIFIGLLGAFFHIAYAIIPAAPFGERVSVPLLVWAPPILGPLTFALVGIFGISAAWKEDPVDSGILQLPGGLRLALPYSKTRAFLFAVSLGSLATVISSVLDHARTNFSNPWLWFPTAVGVFATVTAAALGAISNPSRVDVWAYLTAMLLMIGAGLLGLFLHVQFDLTTSGQIVIERFIRGAPFLAPMLFADIGLWGLIVIFPPGIRTKQS